MILTDGLLRPTIYKGLDRMSIYLNWDAATGQRRLFKIRERHCILEHSHPPEAFWGIFDGMFQIFQNGLLTYRLFDPLLGLDIKRIGVESRYL